MRYSMEKISKLNILDLNKFSILVTRFFFIFCSTQEYLYTEKTDKLLKSLNISDLELQELLEIIQNIIHQAIQNTIQPIDLKDILITNGLHEYHAELFSDLWAESGKMVVTKAKKMSLAEWQMKGLTWELHSETSSTNTARQKQPIALLNFSLFEPDMPLEVKNTPIKQDINAKEFILQMNKKDLFAFYNELEKIQVQIDKLKQ